MSGRLLLVCALLLGCQTSPPREGPLSVEEAKEEARREYVKRCWEVTMRVHGDAIRLGLADSPAMFAQCWVRARRVIK